MTRGTCPTGDVKLRLPDRCLAGRSPRCTASRLLPMWLRRGATVYQLRPAAGRGDGKSAGGKGRRPGEGRSMSAGRSLPVWVATTPALIYPQHPKKTSCTVARPRRATLCAGREAAQPPNDRATGLAVSCQVVAVTARAGGGRSTSAAGMGGDNARLDLPPAPDEDKLLRRPARGDTVRSRRSRRATRLAVSCQTVAGNDDRDRPPK